MDELSQYKTEVASLYLDGIKDAQMKIQAKQELSSKLYDLELSAVRYDSVSVQGGGVSDRVGDTVIKLVELVVNLRNDIADLTEFLERVSSVIDRLDGTHALLLTYRYVNGYSWEQIWDLMSYSRSYVFYLRGEALAAFYDSMPDDMKTEAKAKYMYRTQ